MSAPWQTYSKAIGYQTPVRTHAQQDPFHMTAISPISTLPTAARQVAGGNPVTPTSFNPSGGFQSFFEQMRQGQADPAKSWLDNPLNVSTGQPAIGQQTGLSPLQRFLNGQRLGQQTPALTQNPSATIPPTPTPQTPQQAVDQANGTMGGALTGNKVVDIAKSFVGKVSYHLGAKPSASNNSPSQWDCSGFISWLDKRYGTGKLPGGAHYMYQYGQQTRQLFTDMSQLRPGDIIFLNTHFKGGSGANLNDASHIVMYAGNGMIVHATYGSQGKGTVITKLSAYPAMGKPILGAMHMSWSG